MNPRTEKFLQKYKPGVSKRSLLFVAGCVWTIAGGILITRGLIKVIASNHYLLLELIIAAIVGIMFYIVLFHRGENQVEYSRA